MSADREHCSKEKLLGAWTNSWLSLLAMTKTCWFISISIPDKSSQMTVVVLRESL